MGRNQIFAVVLAAVLLAGCGQISITIGDPVESEASVEAVDFSGSDAKRLLSEEAWVWCIANTGDVADAADALGFAWGGSSVDPVEIYRACSAAAKSDGIGGRHPAQTFIDVARTVGFPARDSEIAAVGLNICDGFDRNGVTSQQITVEVFDAYWALGPISEDLENMEWKDITEDRWRPRMNAVANAAGEIMVGAASASVCREYAADVAAFG